VGEPDDRGHCAISDARRRTSNRPVGLGAAAAMALLPAGPGKSCVSSAASVSSVGNAQTSRAVASRLRVSRTVEGATTTRRAISLPDTPAAFNRSTSPGQLGRLDLMTAPLASHDQAHTIRRRPAQRQWCRLVLPSSRRHISNMPTIELSEDKRAALATFLRDTIAADPYPLAPRWRPIRSALDKIDPQSPRPSLPPLKPAGAPSLYMRKKRGRRL
jgi:hypothetical protein